MSRGRLTKQELGWLLTQEAKGAAARLRVGMQNLKTGPDKAPAAAEGGVEISVDATLDALDDAMRVLSTLHGTAVARGRRGRIDIAAILWEIAPDAQITIEPGAGTEVFGDESELRRMLQIVMGHETGAGAAVHIKRDGDDIRVSCVLGPDSSATSESERALISRMAIRYGGRYELEGGAEVLVLPAEGAAEKSEADQLRKELEEAKKQGEAYARELAQVLTQEDLTSAGPASVRAVPGVERFGVVSRFARGLAGELRGILAAASRQASSAGESASSEEDRWESVRRSLSRAQDFVGMLAAVGELDANEPNAPMDLALAARETARAMSGRATRSEVTIKVEGAGPINVRAAARATEVILRELVAHAISASPRGAEVVLRVERKGAGACVHVDDAGPTVPANAHGPLVALEIEPGTYGRPSAVPLYVASEIAVWQNVSLELGDAPNGGVRSTITFHRPG